jgi:hypothetical protein
VRGIYVKRLFSTLSLAIAFFCHPEAQGTPTYSTTFSATENPISEGARWINGQANGIDWKNVRTIPGRAMGTQSGVGGYDDSTALLTGTWSPTQTVQGTVYSVNQLSGSSDNAEIEFRLRSTITPHNCNGYEVNFRLRHDGSQYVEIVRWNGQLGSFTYVNRGTGPGIYNGDVIKATIVGSVITAYINGVQVLQGTDSTFTGGNPGIGFYLRGTVPQNTDFGFTSFQAWDGGSSAPAPPTNLRISIT